MANTRCKKISNPSRKYPGNIALTATAFQDHLRKSLNLQHGITHNMKEPPKKTKTVRKTVSRNENNSNDNLSPRKRKEFVIGNPKQESLSLAEKYGLVEHQKSNKLSEIEWHEIKRLSNFRKSSSEPCSICKDFYNQFSHQVLLSCSHVFHRQCIFSFEKFSRKKQCPLCRCVNYEKRVIYEGEKITSSKAALKIQSAWRGYQVRKTVKAVTKNRPPNHPLLKKKFYLNKFFELTKDMQTVFDEHDTYVTNLLNDLDISLAKSKSTMDRLEKSSLLDDGWGKVQEKAITMEITDCPICLGSMNTIPKKTVLLSCSHVYHLECFNSYENFCNENLCPLCRKSYTKRIYNI